MESQKGTENTSLDMAAAVTRSGSISPGQETHPCKIPKNFSKSRTKRLHTEDSDFAHSTLKHKKRSKAKKPDGYPTRPLSAYNFFFKEERVKLLEEKREDKDLDDGENPFLGMSAAIGTRWKALSENQKQRYEAAADTDRTRYKKEMAEYSERLIREAAEERVASAERQVQTQTTTNSRSKMKPHEQNTSIQATLNSGIDVSSQLQQSIQVPNGGISNELIQLLPFIVSLHTPIQPNLSAAELLDELHRVQSMTEMLIRNRLRLNQAQTPDSQSFMSLLQLLGE